MSFNEILNEEIKSNSIWLQEEPRTTWEIIMALDPTKFLRVKEVQEAAERFAHILEEEGYVVINDQCPCIWDLEWVKTASK